MIHSHEGRAEKTGAKKTESGRQSKEDSKEDRAKKTEPRKQSREDSPEGRPG